MEVSPRTRQILAAITSELRGTDQALPSLVQSSTTSAPELAVAVRFWEAFLEVDRQLVPAEILQACGRWVFVGGQLDQEWLRLTARTVEFTGGAVDYPMEIADRCRRLNPSRSVLAFSFRNA